MLQRVRDAANLAERRLICKRSSDGIGCPGKASNAGNVTHAIVGKCCLTIQRVCHAQQKIRTWVSLVGKHLALGPNGASIVGHVTAEYEGSIRGRRRWRKRDYSPVSIGVSHLRLNDVIV